MSPHPAGRATLAAAALDYRYLGENVARCEALAAAAGDVHARQLLDLLAERGRGVLAVIDAEPGLHTYLEHLTYSRAVALLAELIRQAYGLVRTLIRQQAECFARDRRSTAHLWEEAESLTVRADELGTAAVRHSPRLGLDTVAGSRALSRRLVNTHQVDEAADVIDAALATASRLPSPDPAVAALAALAASLREQAAALRAGVGDDWWSTYFDRRRREADAAAGRERALVRRPPGPSSGAGLPGQPAAVDQQLEQPGG